SSSVRTSLGQSMDSFFQRIAGVKVQSEYTNALNALKASGIQVDRFTSAVTTMLNSFAKIRRILHEPDRLPQQASRDNRRSDQDSY
ncbi:MAG: hypothetical protein M1510_08285, partial [Nitrospirae bacterium]|nr:hypothetical protein [Nitrospirota bacterium]